MWYFLTIKANVKQFFTLSENNVMLKCRKKIIYTFLQMYKIHQ